jgi:rRNA maturation endonuclease Nob1
MVVRNHLLKGYQCYSCGHNLSKIENINTSFALQLGLRSGDNRLALRPEFNNILKHHVQCEKCKLIICKSCLQNKKTKDDWHNRPYCPKCGSNMFYI